jgi:hypothetical protein
VFGNEVHCTRTSSSQVEQSAKPRLLFPVRVLRWTYLKVNEKSLKMSHKHEEQGIVDILSMIHFH